MGVQPDPGPPPHPLKTTPLFLLQQYAPSVFEKYTASVTVGNKEVTLNLYDTAGKCPSQLGLLSRGFPAGASRSGSLCPALLLHQTGGSTGLLAVRLGLRALPPVNGGDRMR